MDGLEQIQQLIEAMRTAVGPVTSPLTVDPHTGQLGDTMSYEQANEVRFTPDKEAYGKDRDIPPPRSPQPQLSTMDLASIQSMLSSLFGSPSEIAGPRRAVPERELLAPTRQQLKLSEYVKTQRDKQW